MKKVFGTLAAHLQRGGKLDLSVRFIDGTLVAAQKGALVGKTRGRKGTKFVGAGRRRWYSYLRFHNVGFAIRGHTPGRYLPRRRIHTKNSRKSKRRPRFRQAAACTEICAQVLRIDQVGVCESLFELRE